MPEGQVFWATSRSREPEEPPEPAFENELEYLEYVWRDPTKPDRLRYMAAKACADFHFPQYKAIAKVTSKDFASVLDAARLRAASVANVIQLKTGQKALPSVQHDASELKPAPGSADGTGFRCRF
jgi:hypothetical protein